jgi:molybdenum cofactor biosynthesis enzyme MoaA
MSDELLQKLIDEMATYDKPFHFSPFKVNEPLLDKRLYRICKQVEQRTLAHFRLFTNGAPLTQKHIDWIASLNRVTHLWVSLNAVEDDYEKIMQLQAGFSASRGTIRRRQGHTAVLCNKMAQVQGFHYS